MLRKALIGVFAGRIFEDMPNQEANEALAAVRRRFERERQSCVERFSLKLQSS